MTQRQKRPCVMGADRLTRAQLLLDAVKAGMPAPCDSPFSDYAELAVASVFDGERPRDFSARLRRGNRRLIGDAAIFGVAICAALAVIACWSSLQTMGLGNGGPALAATLVPGSTFAIEAMPFEKPGQSFPGSAYYYLSADAAPAPAAAPGGDLAPAAHLDGAPGEPGPAAKAMAMNVNPIDRARALSCMTAAIYYEAASEPDAGQRAVAQVVLNRMAHPGFPKTVCGVVYQGSARASGCQFTFTCDGSLARVPAAYFWRRAQDVAQAALAGYVFTPVGLATHYHTFAVHPYWADSLDFIGQIGAHRFYRMAGPAGDPLAFRFAYGGGEPLPAPNARRNAPASNEFSPDPLAIERAYAAELKAAHGDARAVGVIAANAGIGGGAAKAAGVPTYSREALQRGGDAAFRLQVPPAAGNVLPEYQGSGGWIAEPS
jgi:hypothetical protein